MTKLALTLLFGLVSGCAITDYTVTTAYTPTAMTQPGAVQSAILWDVQVAPTMPSNPTAVGAKKNGYGMVTAEVYVHPDPWTWLANAARAQFQVAGVSLLDNTTPRPLPQITISVAQFFVEPDVGFWGADLTAVTIVDVQVHFGQRGRTFRRRFVGEKTSFQMVWSDGDFQSHLVASAHRALAQASTAVYQILAWERTLPEGNHARS